MKTQSQFRKTPLAPLALFGLALGCLFLSTACMFDADAKAEAEIAGVLQGDIESGTGLSRSAVEVEGAVVTAHEVAADGSVGPVVAQSQTNAQGAFVLKTDLKGKRRLVVRAVREGSEWKARFEDRLESGRSRAVRPLNLESTIDAEVWLELQKTGGGRAVHPSEIALVVDADVSASVAAEFRGNATARAVVIARLEQTVKAASKARAAVLAEASAKVEAASQARADADAGFRAALYAHRGDVVETRRARQHYRRALVRAHADAAVDVTLYARSCEAAYESALKASAAMSVSARAALARAAARMVAEASDAAMQARFRAAGAADAHVNTVASAAVTLHASLEAAASREACEAAMAAYRAEVKAVFAASFAVYAAALGTLSAATDSMSAALNAEVEASADADAVGEAYAGAQAEARAEIHARLETAGEDAARISAAADAMAFLAVSGRS